MTEIFFEIAPALALALTAIVAAGVLIVGIALAFKAIDIVHRTLSCTNDGHSELKEIDTSTSEGRRLHRQFKREFGKYGYK